MEKNVYTDLIEKLKKDFNDSLETEDENEIKELNKGFDEYMDSAVEDMENNDISFLKKDEKSIRGYLEAIAESVIEDDMDNKRRRFATDESFEKIRYYSSKAYKSAENKLLSNGKEIELLRFNKDELIELLNNVKPYNKSIAEQLVSETILDIEYVKQKDADIMSLRLGRLYRDLKKKDDEGR